MLCDVSTSVTSASVFFLSVLHALHDAFRKMRSFVFIERISEVTDVFAARARLLGGQRGDRERRRRRRHLRLHRLRPRVVGVPRAGRGRPAPARDGHRARRRAHERPRPARRHLRADRGEGRPHVLAEPRAAAVLELRRLGDRRLRGVLRGLRVLDDPAARGLRQGADAARSTPRSGLGAPRAGAAPASQRRVVLARDGGHPDAPRARRRHRRGRRPGRRGLARPRSRLLLAVVLVGILPPLRWRRWATRSATRRSTCATARSS